MPAPQPLQRIFLPASSGFVENFRPHDGHLNRNVRGSGALFSPTVSIGTGAVIVFAHPAHVIFCPACDHPKWFTCPQALQVNGNVMRDPTSRAVQRHCVGEHTGETSDRIDRPEPDSSQGKRLNSPPADYPRFVSQRKCVFCVMRNVSGSDVAKKGVGHVRICLPPVRPSLPLRSCGAIIQCGHSLWR
jgi:hypothetical protein